MLSYFWLIPLLPLVGVLANGLLGARVFRSERVIGGIACGVLFISFVIGVGAFLELASMPPAARHIEVELFDWIPAGVAHLHGNASGAEAARFHIPFAFQFDPLSAIMVLVVTGVGFLIHVYATGYMHGDPGFFRFFTYLNLFAAFMLVLVLGNSFATMFIGWEGVGLCSYLLIGYYYGKRSAGDAGKKAFVVNRVGDAGFLLAIFTIFFTFGTLDYDGVFEQASHLEVGTPVVTLITLLLLVGAAGKSAQIPLFTWLPDAMEGPTPVSALIHAATMVTAGVYMVVRSNVLFSLSPTSMTVVAIVGAATALFAASIALVQNDIKRVLAYSTISQLGYMFLACGVGAYVAGVFHLVTHAFFKALLFLAAGSVMHALSDELDMWKMGNLRNFMPITHKTFLVGTLAIAGIPGLAGFFSKDEILWYSWSGPNGHPILWILGVAAAGMTAFYMTRLLLVAFYGESRMDAEVERHVHESPSSMTYPLIVLAALSILGGYIGIPAALRVGPLAALHESGNIFGWLEPVVSEPHGVETGEHGLLVGGGSELLAALEPLPLVAQNGHDTGLELTLMLVSVVVALAGIGLAGILYSGGAQRAERLADSLRAIYRVLWNKYWVDELYDALFVNRAKDLGRVLWIFDDAIVDGMVNGTGNATLQTATASTEFDNRVVDGTVNGVGSSMMTTSGFFRLLQTGLVQNYALIIILGAFVLVSATIFF